MSTLTIKQFPKLCRFCLLESTELELICNIPSVKIFWKISGVENLEELPQKICSHCIQVFQSFTKFIEDCVTNFNSLKIIYENSCVTTESKASPENERSLEADEESDNAYILFNAELKVKQEDETAHFKCEICKTKFGCVENLNSHTCDKTTIKETYLRRKTVRKWSSKQHRNKCKTCQDTFKRKSELLEHYKSSVSCIAVNFTCLQCSKSFKKKHLLNVHMGCHMNDALFKCSECDKGFRFQQNLKRHMLIHKGIKKFTCEDCGKAFSRAHVLREHKNIHTGSNPYVCNYCGKGFKRYANHFIHVYRHKLLNGEVDQTKETKLYLQLKCVTCNKVFASRGALENHLLLHQAEVQGKKFLCTDCGKGFNTKGQLDSHMRTHTGYSPYECEQCGKKFKQKSAFNNHRVMHSGVKPYQCNICEKCFTQSGHLKIHMRLHSGERPFSCSFCQKTFVLNGNLKVHLRTHTGEKPYSCSVCSKAYYNSTSLKKHMKSHSLSTIDQVPENVIETELMSTNHTS